MSWQPRWQGIKWFQEKRLQFILKTVNSRRYINRADIVAEFGVSQAQASLDIRLLLQLNPGYIIYNKTTKRYHIKKECDGMESLK